jgi:hypothetical protein
MSDPTRTTCPHCGAALAPLEISEVFFEYAHDRACFNDDCPYYVRGWEWMERQFGVRSSYRYRVDGSGRATPLAVFSGAGLRSGALPLPGEAPAAAPAEERP